MKKLAVIGLGLIGGSLALDLKKRKGMHVIGVDTNSKHCKQALELGIVDEVGSLEAAINADVIIISIPVDKIPELVHNILDQVGSGTLVLDVGSVKEEICNAVSGHARRSQFLAAHPLAGTEFSGPTAALSDLFDEKVCILCEPDKTDWKLLDKAIDLFKLLNMRLKMMQPAEHDRHIAYVSHLSHVSSFMLGKTVLEIEKNEQHIFDMASTGFASTVRLAKSASSTWTPIFLENRENVLRALDEYIKNLNRFREMLNDEDATGITGTMDNTNYIKSILSGIKENND